MYIDSVHLTEKPEQIPSLTTPRVLNFPNDYTRLKTEGWEVVRGADGVARIGTTMRGLPAGEYREVADRPLNPNGCAVPLRKPVLRLWVRYDLTRNSQEFRVQLKPQENLPLTKTIVRREDGGKSGLTRRIDISLEDMVGDLGLMVEFIVSTASAGSGPGVEIERVEVVDGPEQNPTKGLIRLTLMTY